MHVKRLPAWVALLLTSLVSSIHADTYPRQIGVDALHYIFRLTLGDTSDEIAGEATVRVRFLAHGVNDLFLDLASAATGKGMIVSEVSSDGRQLTFTHRDARLRISLSSPSRSGQTTSVTIQYHGVPIDGLRLIPNIFGDRTIFSENWPNKARHWLPMIDHPYDKATGEFIVTAPAHYQVVANGLLVEENDIGNGERRTHWKQSVPIASWLYAIGVARFSVHHAGLVKGVPLQSWVFPQDRDKRDTLFEVSSRTAMEFFTEKVGPYSYEKLANVQAAGIAGATEHATAIFYGEKEVSTNRLPAWIVVHEVAHQWFGNAVTERDWDDVWLSEGFATYADAEHWIREKITFSAAYNDERVIAYLFLPKHGRPPYQTVVHFPSAGAIYTLSSTTLRMADIDFLLLSGRAVLYPVVKGTYERQVAAGVITTQPALAFRNFVIQTVNDVRRSVDFLKTRSDINADSLAYYGWSWGAAEGARVLAMESHFKAAVLVVGGYYLGRLLPEVEQLHFAPRVKAPVLMINAETDLTFPLETSQKPMFAHLGTPPEHKRHMIFPGGHDIFFQRRSQIVKEALDWLDRYLGTRRTLTASQRAATPVATAALPGESVPE